MRNQHFSSEKIISDRSFWIGAILYAALVIGATSAFGGVQNADYSGTLIFGGNAPVQTDTYRSTLTQLRSSDYGAVTLRSNLLQNFSTAANQSATTTNAASFVSTQIPASTSVAGNQTAISVASGGGITAMDIALGEEPHFIGEEITPVPEPATWFAALLVTGAIVWGQRRRIARSFSYNNRGCPRRVVHIAGPFTVVLLSASFALASDDFARRANLDSGNEILAPGHTLIDRMFDSIGYENNIEWTMSSSRLLAASQPQTITNVNLTHNMNMTVTGAPGQTVTLSLKNFLMSGTSTFTLQGTATTTFVINVSKQFRLSGSSQIVLSSGVLWDHVLFNIRGKGTADIGGQSTLRGVVNAPQRTVRVTDQGTVYGEVNAKKIVLRDDGKIVRPPVVSPEQPPAGEVITLSKIWNYFANK